MLPPRILLNMNCSTYLLLIKIIVLDVDVQIQNISLPLSLTALMTINYVPIQCAVMLSESEREGRSSAQLEL